jgi:nicotinate-nucleotide adenylyltransferase
MTAPLGIFGGTFDPIHFGHLRTAFELLQVLQLGEMRFVPAGDPPHRDRPRANAELRLEFVREATGDQPGFAVDAREVERKGPSYTVVTLGELRAEFPRRPLCLCLGMDAFLGLQQWHRWDELLGLAHMAIAHRPGSQAPAAGPLADLLAEHATRRVADLHESPAGRIYVHAVTQLEISSTGLRELLAAGQDSRYLVPDAVGARLRETGCYLSLSQQPTR